MSGIPRYAATRDENEPEIVEALERSGWGVARISLRGFPDLVVARARQAYLFEVLGPAKLARYRSAGGLTPDQVEFHDGWPGDIYKVESVDDALAIVRQRR